MHCREQRAIHRGDRLLSWDLVSPLLPGALGLVVLFPGVQEGPVVLILEAWALGAPALALEAWALGALPLTLEAWAVVGREVPALEQVVQP
jgi:hypothetical protein